MKIDPRKQQELWDLCEIYIQSQAIRCEETVYQCDWISESSLEFISDVCKIVGYYKEEDEGL